MMVVQADGVMVIQGEMNSERQVVWWLGKMRQAGGRNTGIRDPVNTLAIIESDTKHN